MKITNGMFAKCGYKEEYLTLLTNFFETEYEDTNGVEITLAFQDDEGKHLRAILSYMHPLADKKNSYIIIDPADKPEDAIRSLLESWQQQLSCEHELVRKKDPYGNEYPDGSATCNHCQLDLDQGLSVIPNKQIISLAMKQDGVVAQYNWGECGLQGGDDGLVIRRQQGDTYRTAFVEAFPNVHGFGTFIRGEGENIQQAEDACWEKYQRRLACENHEWTRTVNGRERTDGYAQCIHCGLSTKDALRPSTICKVCSEPTTNKLDDEFLCYTHYYEVDEEVLLQDHLKSAKEYEGDSYNEEKETLEFYIEHRFMKPFLEHFGEEEFQLFESSIRHVGYHFSGILLRRFFKIHPFNSGEIPYPSIEHEHIKVCLKHVHSNIIPIEQYLRGEEKSLSNDFLIPETYARNFA